MIEGDLRGGKGSELKNGDLRVAIDIGHIDDQARISAEAWFTVAGAIDRQLSEAGTVGMHVIEFFIAVAIGDKGNFRAVRGQSWGMICEGIVGEL